MFLGLLDPDPSINKQKINRSLDFCSLPMKTGVNLPTESNKQKKKNYFLLASEVTENTELDQDP